MTAALDPRHVARELVKWQDWYVGLCDADQRTYDVFWRVEAPVEGPVAEEVKRLRYGMEVGSVDPDTAEHRPAAFVAEWRLLGNGRRYMRAKPPLCPRRNDSTPAVTAEVAARGPAEGAVDPGTGER